MSESPPSEGALRDYERKRRRAMIHLAELRHSVDAFTDGEREPVRGAFDARTSQYVFEIPLQRHPTDWALLLGDYAYNARASLDYLITALVSDDDEEKRRTNAFPIYGLETHGWQEIDDWWERDPKGLIKRQLCGTPAATKAALKRLQPFYEVPLVDPNRHPLLHLRELSNRDKHRRLNLVVRRASLDFVNAKGKAIFHGPPPTARVNDDRGGDIYTVTLGAPAKRDGDIFIRPAYSLALHEPPELMGDLIPTVTAINSYIDEQVVPTIRALLPGD